ncbi:ISL3 family transposase [Pseudomonas putida]|nr:ISL3 family transposase [Pseudomonas putida]
MTDILDLPGWKVLASRLEDGTYIIEAEYLEPLQACTKCGLIGKLYRHGPKIVSYRDSPIRGAHAQLAAKVQRYKCRECSGTSLQPLGGIDIERRMTTRCLEYIEQQCMRDTFTRVAEHVGCDEKTVRNIAQGLIARTDGQFSPVMPEWLGIDETKLAGEMRGILTDVVNRRPVDILPSRDPRSIAQWLHSNGAPGRVKGVATDMHRPYHNVVRDILPGVPVVVDKFHVVRMAGNGLDQVRIRLGKAAGKQVNLGWKRSKILLNKSRANLSAKQEFNLQMWLDNEPSIAQAYQFKEDFYAWYDLPREEAASALDAWIKAVTDSELKADFKEILSALKNWREPILAYFDYPITNGYTEALNGVAKVINRAGRGYTFDVIRARVLSRSVVSEASVQPLDKDAYIKSWNDNFIDSLVELSYRVTAADGRCESCMRLADLMDFQIIDDKVLCKQCISRLGREMLGWGEAPFHT